MLWLLNDLPWGISQKLAYNSKPKQYSLLCKSSKQCNIWNDRSKFPLYTFVIVIWCRGLVCLTSVYFDRWNGFCRWWKYWSCQWMWSVALCQDRRQTGDSVVVTFPPWKPDWDREIFDALEIRERTAEEVLVPCRFANNKVSKFSFQ